MDTNVLAEVVQNQISLSNVFDWIASLLSITRFWRCRYISATTAYCEKERFVESH